MGATGDGGVGDDHLQQPPSTAPSPIPSAAAPSQLTSPAAPADITSDVTAHCTAYGDHQNCRAPPAPAQSPTTPSPSASPTPSPPYASPAAPYYLHATHERSPITIYTFTTYPGLQPPRHHPRPVWEHPLHVAPTPRKRPAHHAHPQADSNAPHGARRRPAAHHQNHLLPRINAGPGTVTEPTHKSTLNLLARKLRPKMALEDTLWVYYGESRTAGLADLRTIIPRGIQRAVGPFTVYAVPHPITAQ